jgi:hypothetical protein
MASSVYNSYAQSAGEINNNLASFREDVDNIKAVNRQIVAKNKQLLQDAYTKTDLDALRGLGEEVGIRQFKKYGGRALDYVDNRFLGGKIGSDTEGFNNMVRGKFNQLRGQAEESVDDLMGRGRSAFREGESRLSSLRENISRRMGQGADDDGDVEMNEIGGGEGGAQGGEGFEADGSATSGAVDDPANVDESDMSFDDFMNQFEVPRTETGDIDFDRAGEQMNMVDEDMRGQQLRSNAPRREPSSAPEETGEETKEGEPVDEETGESGGNLGAEEGEDALADAGEAGAETGVEEGVGAGLEGVGTALDATGVGAIVGVPLQVAGAVLEGGALYEAGKGIVDWVEQLFGKKPDAPSVKKVSIPKPPPTLAQRGMLITPTMDTLDTQPSFAGGW